MKEFCSSPLCRKSETISNLVTWRLMALGHDEGGIFKSQFPGKHRGLSNRIASWTGKSRMILLFWNYDWLMFYFIIFFLLPFILPIPSSTSTHLPPPCNYYFVVCVHEFSLVFLFCLISTSPSPLQSCQPASIYESVSTLLVNLVCSLDSIYE